MNWADIAQVVGKAAPLLGAALPLPGGAAIGTLIAAALGVDAGSPDALADKLKQDPQASIKLLELQNQHEAKLQEMMLQSAQFQLSHSYNVLALEVKDRMNAREHKDWVAQFLSVTVTIGFFIILTITVTVPMPKDSQSSINMMLGSLITTLTCIVGFHFGSSYGSKEKGIALNNR